jgi:hypothetical protein
MMVSIQCTGSKRTVLLFVLAANLTNQTRVCTQYVVNVNDVFSLCLYFRICVAACAGNDNYSGRNLTIEPKANDTCFLYLWYNFDCNCKEGALTLIIFFQWGLTSPFRVVFLASIVLSQLNLCRASFPTGTVLGRHLSNTYDLIEGAITHMIVHFAIPTFPLVCCISHWQLSIKSFYFARASFIVRLSSPS